MKNQFVHQFRVNDLLLKGHCEPIVAKYTYLLDFTNRDIKLVYSLN